MGTILDKDGNTYQYGYSDHQNIVRPVSDPQSWEVVSLTVGGWGDPLRRCERSLIHLPYLLHQVDLRFMTRQDNFQNCLLRSYFLALGQMDLTLDQA